MHIKLSLVLNMAHFLVYQERKQLLVSVSEQPLLALSDLGT